jgi:hypothetical protein
MWVERQIQRHPDRLHGRTVNGAEHRMTHHLTFGESTTGGRQPSQAAFPVTRYTGMANRGELCGH